MYAKSKPFGLLLIALMLLIQVIPVSAQGKTPPNPDQLTSAQMKNAVVVKDGTAASRANMKGEVYRFANCDKADPDAPCYFMVMGSSEFAKSGTSTSATTLSSSATLSCVTPIYNGFGTLKAKLQQNVNVSFWGTFGQTPVTLNWGDRAGTGASPLYTWTDLTGPNPNPGWGVYVSRTGSAYSTAGGMLHYTPAPPLTGWEYYISNRLTIRSSGWSCS